MRFRGSALDSPVLSDVRLGAKSVGKVGEIRARLKRRPRAENDWRRGVVGRHVYASVSDVDSDVVMFAGLL
jgi:hypothetical protein